MKLFPSAVRRSLTALAGGAILSLVVGAGPSAIAAPAGDPAAGIPAVTTALPNLAKTLIFAGWQSYCNRYERMEHAVVLSAAKAQVKVVTCNYTTGGTKIPFGVDTTLTLTLDGKAVATAAVKAADTVVTFDVNIAGIAEGWYRASVDRAGPVVVGPGLQRVRAQGRGGAAGSLDAGDHRQSRTDFRG